MKASYDLSGSTALVTGAVGEFGRTVGLLLAASGARLVLTDVEGAATALSRRRLRGPGATNVCCGLAGRRRGLRRPNRARAGFDDAPLADLVVPGVTVAAQNPAEVGRIAALTPVGD